MAEILLIVILCLSAWFWLDSMDKRERAILLGRELADRFNLQLLDESVSCNRIWLARNRRGHAQFLRTYAFEVSADGANRMQCHLTILGSQLGAWHIPPYLEPDA